MAQEKSRRLFRHAPRYFLTGILTVIPIWLTWIVFEFFFKQLSQVGRPGARALSKTVEKFQPDLAEWFLQPWFQSLVAVLLTILALYLLGWFTNMVIGKRMLAMMDWVINRIPLVQTVYGAIKKLLSALQQKPDKVQRVVLIEFPTPEMKTVGFVTRILKDHATGAELAAVYVPTTPNPTSGYLEIVPLERVVSTDWTIDEAMTFIMSGGAVAPDRIHYSKSAPNADAVNTAAPPASP